MARKLRPAGAHDMARIKTARRLVADAAYELAMARCPASHKKARSLLKSINGAIRHAERRIMATQKESNQ